MEQEIGTWDSVLLENLTEDSFISNLHQRYKRDFIYTYIGTSVVAVNPFKTLSLYSPELINAYGSKGIFQLPPHIYGLANLAFQSLKDQSEDQCIVLSGESGSGKTESFRMVVHFLTQIQDAKMSKSKCTARRRNSSGCSATSSPRPSSHPNSRPSTPKRQSPVTFAEKSGCLLKTRSESTDRSNMPRLSREKVVDFDFSHHKSSENIPQHVSVQTTPKSCFKHNHVDAIGRSKTLTNVDYCIRKSNCDLTKNISTNRINETTLLSNKLNACCANSINPKVLQHGVITYQEQAKSKSMSQGGATIVCCKHCTHIKCIKHKSFESNEDCRSIASTLHCSNSSIAPVTRAKSDISSRGSCLNLARTLQTACNASLSSVDPSKRCSRTSLIDMHKSSLRSDKGRSSNLSLDCSSDGGKNFAQKIRDRVACCDTFLDAMGNATTTRNSNSSRYGKFFDIEIDYRGEPIGIHITHYSRYSHKSR